MDGKVSSQGSGVRRGDVESSESDSQGVTEDMQWSCCHFCKLNSVQDDFCYFCKELSPQVVEETEVDTTRTQHTLFSSPEKPIAPASSVPRPRLSGSRNWRRPPSMFLTSGP